MTKELLEALPLAAVTATDLNAAMVGFGSSRTPAANWQLRFELEARGDFERATETIAEDMEARLGPGPVSGQLAAHVVDAAPIT